MTARKNLAGEAQVAAPPSATSPKKGKGSGKGATAKASKSSDEKSPSHPPVARMINDAIVKLNDKGGSSYQAIKKAIAEVHHVDVEKLSLRLKKALKKGVETGAFVQLKGKGANGSFKLAEMSKPVKKAKKMPAAGSSAKKAAASKKSEEKAPDSKKDTKVKSSKKAAPSSTKAKVTKPTTEKKAPVPKKGKSSPKMKLPKTMKAKSPPSKPTDPAKKAPAKKQ